MLVIVFSSVQTCDFSKVESERWILEIWVGRKNWMIISLGLVATSEEGKQDRGTVGQNGKRVDFTNVRRGWGMWVGGDMEDGGRGAVAGEREKEKNVEKPEALEDFIQGSFFLTTLHMFCTTHVIGYHYYHCCGNTFFISGVKSSSSSSTLAWFLWAARCYCSAAGPWVHPPCR